MVIFRTKKRMIELRDCVRTLLEYQTEDYPNEEIKAQQAKLNALYDAFTRKYGLINSRGNAIAFDQDSSYFLLCSLEILDEDRNLKRKADLFTKRTIRSHKPAEKVDTAVEALALSIGEKAHDGPGFTRETLSSPSWKVSVGLIRKTVPTSSLVGMSKITIPDSP